MFSEQFSDEIQGIFDRVAHYCTWVESQALITADNIETDPESLDLYIGKVLDISDIILSYDHYLPSVSGEFKDIEVIEVRNNVIDIDGFTCIFQIFSNLLKIAALKEKYEEYSYLSDIEIPYSDLVKSLFRKYRNFFDSDRRFVEDRIPGLSSVVRQITSKRDEIIRRISEYTDNNREHLTDDFHRFMDGRYVLPFQKADRKKVIVHSVSDSGNTFFAEPFWLVEMNNDLQGLTMEKERIIRKFYSDLSQYLYSEKEGIFAAVKFYMIFDCMYAKAYYKARTGFLYPEISDEIRLYSVQNPLIKGEVVPNDIMLPSGKNIFVVSGPTAGGKTVLIKSLLSCLVMFQSGIAVPVGEQSVIRMFRDFHDIFGDESSILNSMSTFSSHAGRLAQACCRSHPGSIVFVDEIFSGTDPAEGSALAIACIEHLIETGAVVFFTTHLNSIKHFFFNQEDSVSVSMRFDTSIMEPVYKAYYNSMNSSYAFEIAEKTGIPLAVIEKAREILSREENSEVRGLIEHLEKERDAEAEKVRRLIEDEEKIRELKDELYREKLKLRERMNRKYLKKVRDLEDEFEEYRRKALEKVEKVKTTKDVESFYEPVARLSARKRELTGKKRAGADPASLKPGDSVFSGFLNSYCKVISVQSESVVLENRGKKITVKADRLYVDDRVEKNERPAEIKDIRVSSPGSFELSLIGVRYDDAMERVEDFIDRAFMFNMGSVRIVHGRGVLREAVKNKLSDDERIKKICYAEQAAGGDGVSVITLN
ncbi:MAG: endonuclease MutS2 [Candidatus Muiribacteriaceae bacterium]